MAKNLRTFSLTKLFGILAGVALLATAPSAQRIGPDPSAMPGMAQMMADAQTMMTEMIASQEKLDELVGKMNSAKGPDKVDRVAEVLTLLVKEHKAMAERMWSTHGRMMEAMPKGRQ